MTREEAVDYMFKEWFYLEEENKIVLRNNIDKIYDYFESRSCENCKWIKNEVCVNDESRLVADFVTSSDICKLWESRNDN